MPRTIIISILAFPLFPCSEFYSEYQVIEVKRHTPLTNRLLMIYFELAKLSELLDTDASDELKLWLSLFNAKSEEELAKIESLGGSIMQQAVSGYRHVTATDEFKEIERMRSRARHNEASALQNAEDAGMAAGRAAGMAAGGMAKAFFIAKNMIADGEPLEKIMRYTGLTRDDLENLHDAD